MGPALLWVPAFIDGTNPYLILNILRTPPGRAMTSKTGKSSSKSSKLPGPQEVRFPRPSSAHFAHRATRAGRLRGQRNTSSIFSKLPRHLSTDAPKPTLKLAKSTWVPGILDRGSVEAGEEATSAGDLVGILAGLAGHGADQVAVTPGVICVEIGSHWDLEKGTPAVKAACREKGTRAAARGADQKNEKPPAGMGRGGRWEVGRGSQARESGSIPDGAFLKPFSKGATEAVVALPLAACATRADIMVLNLSTHRRLGCRISATHCQEADCGRGPRFAVGAITSRSA